MRKVRILVSALLLVLLLAACAPKAAPAPQALVPAVPAPRSSAPAPAAVPAVSAKPAWEVEWNKVLAAGKQETRVTISSSAAPEVRQAIVKIARMQGITAEVITASISETTRRLSTERSAGLYLTDIWIGGPLSLYDSGKPKGWFQTLEPALILPDLTDPERIEKVFYQGKFPWVDKDHTILITSLQPQMPLAINTNLVKPDEVKSFRDLLNPKWKGKIIAADPTRPSAAQEAFSAIWVIMGEEFLRELAKTELPIVTDQRLQIDWLAQGKAAILVFPRTASLPEFYDAKAPIIGMVPAEGTFMSAGVGGVTWLKNMPHPNAAKVFINWLMSGEGQEIWSPPGGYHSIRLDVSTVHLRPFQMRQPGVKYVDAYTEEATKRRDVTDSLAKDLFGPKK